MTDPRIVAVCHYLWTHDMKNTWCEGTKQEVYDEVERLLGWDRKAAQSDRHGPEDVAPV